MLHTCNFLWLSHTPQWCARQNRRLIHLVLKHLVCKRCCSVPRSHRVDPYAKFCPVASQIFCQLVECCCTACVC
jgi:hypothetical protein